jgi:catechol 2,3-dioxygenase-like lactoylglutathione lyase family enzyme
MMYRLLPAVAVVLLAVSPARAQLATPNASGVAMGHLHYFVEDVAANRDFWVALGGTPLPFAAGEIVKMPGVLILISERASQSDGSLIDHVAFRVESLGDLASRGFELEMVEAYPGIASVYTPDGDRVELFEEGTATNVGFDVEGTTTEPTAVRHNRPIAGPIDSHHLHFYVPEEQVLVARAWYVEHFGAVAGTRWRYAAADLPGMNLNFSAADVPRPPSAGKSLDHIGFEVDNLEAFCEQLAAAGISFDQPFSRLSRDLAVAILTDPWGATLELTEGLADY